MTNDLPFLSGPARRASLSALVRASERSRAFSPSPAALASGLWDEAYPACWQSIPRRFDPAWRPPPGGEPYPFDPDAQRDLRP